MIQFMYAVRRKSPKLREFLWMKLSDKTTKFLTHTYFPNYNNFLEESVLKSLISMFFKCSTMGGLRIADNVHFFKCS